MEVVVRDLKTAPPGELLADADVLITSSRPSSLARLGLGPAALAAHPRLCHVAIVGYATPTRRPPAHDLNYQAAAGLVRPPQLPAQPAAPTWPAASARRSRRSRCWPSATGPDAAARRRSRSPTPRLALAAPLRAGLTARRRACSAAATRSTPSTRRRRAASPSAAWSRSSPTGWRKSSARARPTELAAAFRERAGRRLGAVGARPRPPGQRRAVSYAPTSARNRVRQPSQQK